MSSNANSQLQTKWSAPLLCFDGYATVARASVQSLVRSGVQVEVEPFNTDPNYMRLLDAQAAGDWAQILGIANPIPHTPLHFTPFPTLDN